MYWWGKRLVPVADKDAHLKDPEQLLLGTPYSQPTLCNLVHGCEILFHNPNLDCQKLQALCAIKGVTFIAYGHSSCFYELCVINSCFKRTTLTFLPGNHKVVDLCTGSGHCVMLTSDGQVLTWGSNEKGQLGKGG